MSLLDYVVRRDHFQTEEYGHGFNFPCCACVHRHGLHTDDPCAHCDHNDSAFRALCGDRSKQPAPTRK